MRHQGRITQWKDEQGYGFVTPNGGGAALFLHIKAFRPGQSRPAGDELVTYDLARDAKGRPRAEAVAFVRGTGRKKDVIA
ncbi:MAG: cold shock domain-containing protein, partial [Dechloromonas sp.]|nr:cold shock domain-containing protein [Dechloromonas sp.]